MSLVEMLQYAKKKHIFFGGVDFKIFHPQILLPHPNPPNAKVSLVAAQ